MTRHPMRYFTLACWLLLPLPALAESPSGDDSGASEETSADPAPAADNSQTLEAMQTQLQTLQDRLDSLDSERASQAEDEELEALRREAEQQAMAPVSAEERSEELSRAEVFTSGQRALQALNPEISVVLDAGGQAVMHDYDLTSILRQQPGAGGRGASAFYFRHLGLHIESALDPFAFTKIAIGISPAGIGLGEAYATWVAVLPGLSLTVGKFLQQFGVINRWHTPSLDQFDRPLAQVEILGGGLNQIGFSLDYLVPSPVEFNSNTLTLQVTTPSNAHLFTGEYLDVPTFLLHSNSYVEIFAGAYVQLGLTGMYGMNNQIGAELAGEAQPAFDGNGDALLLFNQDGVLLGPLTGQASTSVEPFRGNVWLGGADFTASWSPLSSERYHHLTWRSELYAVSQERRDATLQAMGGYSYVDVGLSEAWAVGARADLTQPFVVDPGDLLRWQGVVYATFWQSPWVKMRLQASHADGAELPVDDRVVLQFVWSAGPHKHERY